MNNETVKVYVDKLKQHKEILFVAIPFGLILISIVVYLISAQINTVAPTNNGQQPTGTRITSQPFPSPLVTVNSVSPLNGTTGVDIYTPIKVVFKKPVSLADQKNYIINTNPATQGKVSWSSDMKTLSFTPNDSFVTDTQYTVLLVQNSNSSSWTFKTKSFSNLSEEEVMRGEKESADYTKQVDKEFSTNYPWWNSFPLQKPQYFVYFDVDQKKFVALLYPKSSGATSVDTQVTTMKNEILPAVRNITTDVDKYGIEWKVTPEL